MKVPTVNQRRWVPMRAIRDVVRQIAEQFQPKKIILMDTPLKEIEQAIQIC